MRFKRIYYVINMDDISSYMNLSELVCVLDDLLLVNVLKTKPIIEFEKLSVYGLLIKQVVESRSNGRCYKYIFFVL